MSAQTSTPDELDIALFLRREKYRLPQKHHEFIDYIIWYLTCLHWPGPNWPELTLKQHEYLCHLFDRLGGKIT